MIKFYISGLYLKVTDPVTPLLPLKRISILLVDRNMWVIRGPGRDKQISHLVYWGRICGRQGGIKIFIYPLKNAI